MGNQQPSNLVILCRNAKLGDGTFWKHPETRNYKLIYTSTSPELLEVKRQICPEIFATGVRPIRGLEQAKGRFPNARPMYRLVSTVHPLITEYARKDILEVHREFTLQDYGLWYLDDGTLIERRDRRPHLLERGEPLYRTFLCIGNLLDGWAREEEFFLSVREHFGERRTGSVGLNNSKATNRNLTWRVPKRIADQIHESARKYGILLHKFPR